VALLLHTLVAYGNAAGRTALQDIEGDQHFPNLFAVMVGATSKGRKGTAWGRIRRYFGLADRDWTEHRILGGLSSDEGLIWAVRDPISKQEKAPHRKASDPLQYEQVVVDAGVTDKRLLALEPEFASVLRRIDQDGNSLSALMRLAWDTGRLSTLTKNTPPSPPTPTFRSSATSPATSSCATSRGPSWRTASRIASCSRACDVRSCSLAVGSSLTPNCWHSCAGSSAPSIMPDGHHG
jgi:hypothetical protein